MRIACVKRNQKKVNSLSGATISDHLKAFRTLFDHPRNRRLFLFLDEVQDSPAWEVELTRHFGVLANLKMPVGPGGVI